VPSGPLSRPAAFCDPHKRGVCTRFAKSLRVFGLLAQALLSGDTERAGRSLGRNRIMHSTRTPRFITFTSLVATGALGLSTVAGCDRADVQGELTPSVVQGERAANPPATPPSGAVERAPEAADRPGVAQGSPVPAAPSTRPTAAATPSPRAPQSPGADSSAASVVKRLVLASRVEQREPVALTGDAALGEPLVAFLELSHPGEEPLDLVVTFEHASGQKVGFVELRVPEKSPRFRTWARTQNVRQSGQWQAVVRQKDGPELARQSFTVAEPPASPPNPS
jgi:hypothetical protein